MQSLLTTCMRRVYPRRLSKDPVTSSSWPVCQTDLQLACISVESFDCDHHEGERQVFKWTLRVAKGFGIWRNLHYVALLKGKTRTPIRSIPVSQQVSQLSADSVIVEFEADPSLFSNAEELAAFEFQ
jgi:hypothetical protein